MIPKAVIRRILRLAPVYYCMLCAYALLAGGEDSRDCSWWRLATNLAFVQNYFPPNDQGGFCFATSWTLGVTLHLYLLTPFLVMLYKRSMKAGHAVSTLAVIAGLWLRWHFEPDAGPARMTHFRFGPYVVGVMACFIQEQQLIKKEWGKHLVWSPLLLAVTYFVYDAPCGAEGRARPGYAVAEHTLFGIVIALFALGCLAEPSTSPLNSFFKHPFFAFWSKYSFGSYLTHMVVMVPLHNRTYFF